MKLKDFEINNFRSIKHLKCKLSPKITILAGKNESGKTNILLALNRFGTKFNDDDIPNFADKEDISITATFLLDDSEINSIEDEFETTSGITSNEIKVKTTPIKDYEFSGELYDKLKTVIIDESKEARDSFNQIVKEMKESNESGNLPLVTVDNLEMSTISQNSSQLTSMQTQITQNPALYGPKTTLQHITSAIDLIPKITSPAKKLTSLQEQFESIIPNFIYFNSFEDQLPSEIDLTEAITQCADEDKLSIVRDFVKLSKLNLEELQNPDRQHRAKVTNKATKISSDIFGKYWDQDPIEIVINYDEPKLTFFVKDQDKDFPFKPSQRSKGVQWFMCFLARLFSERSSSDNLILIDEPGLYLHSQAQQNVLNRLEDLSDENNQIIFSTHSPYLIDPSKLNRVRLVIKTSDKITTLENQFNKNADIETIAPIITAIGLDLSQGIGFSKEKNIIVEGVSDYYYLLGMKKFLEKTVSSYKFPENIAIIPCVGESKVSLLASFFMGYNLDYQIVLDEKGTRHTRKKLENDGLDDKILLIGNKDQSIEDLFDKEDFEKFCTSENDKLSKTYASKLFLEKVENNEISSLKEATVTNFLSTLNNLK